MTSTTDKTADVDEDLPAPLQIRTGSEPDPDDEPGPQFRVDLDGQIIKARRPKIALYALALATFGDKYADDSSQARAVFDFLEASLDHDSYGHVLRRLKDRDDEFGTAALAQLFEGMVEEMKRLEPGIENPDEQRPVGRAARRASPRRG